MNLCTTSINLVILLISISYIALSSSSLGINLETEFDCRVRFCHCLNTYLITDYAKDNFAKYLKELAVALKGVVDCSAQDLENIKRILF